MTSIYRHPYGPCRLRKYHPVPEVVPDDIAEVYRHLRICQRFWDAHPRHWVECVLDIEADSCAELGLLYRQRSELFQLPSRVDRRTTSSKPILVGARTSCILIKVFKLVIKIIIECVPTLLLEGFFTSLFLWIFFFFEKWYGYCLYPFLLQQYRYYWYQKISIFFIMTTN